MKLHEYLTQQIAMCGKTQKDIASDLGYEKPNIITMFKQNKTKVPIDKIKPLAISIGADPVSLLRMAMNEYMPATWDALEGVIGNIVTKNEMEIIKFVRLNSEGNDPEITTKKHQDLLRAFAESLE